MKRTLVVCVALLTALGACSSPQDEATEAVAEETEVVENRGEPVPRELEVLGPVPENMFGMHVPLVSCSQVPAVAKIPDCKKGSWPDVPIQSLRLWDSYTTWRDIELRNDSFNWAALDLAVETAEKNGASLLLVLGPTPSWSATF